MQPTSHRLYYVDALRVSAFGLLILYHSSAAFLYDLDWLFNSPEKSQTLSLVTLFPRAWRLALLFFVSGMGTWFAFRSQTTFDFLKGRFLRLFLPLIFAMCVIIVPQVWYERLSDGRFQGSLLEFWVLRYFTEGKYPTGNFSWAHMWFVAYLLVMTVICTPIFRLFTLPSTRRLSDWFERTARSPAIYLFVLLPLALHLIFLPFFPRETNVLYNDGAWFAVWASWFGLGFLVAKHHPALVEPCHRRGFDHLALPVFLGDQGGQHRRRNRRHVDGALQDADLLAGLDGDPGRSRIRGAARQPQEPRPELAERQDLPALHRPPDLRHHGAVLCSAARSLAVE